MVARKPVLTTTRPLVDARGVSTQEMRSWSQQVDLSMVILGEGSPEGVVEAEQWQEYIDTTGSTGTFKYIKSQEAIAGDKAQGWVLL